MYVYIRVNELSYLAFFSSELSRMYMFSGQAKKPLCLLQHVRLTLTLETIVTATTDPLPKQILLILITQDLQSGP